MKKSALTMVSLAVVAVGAVLMAQHVLRPTQEGVERSRKVLTNAYRPSLVSCSVVDDAGLPKTLTPPGVDEDLLYIEVVILYPGVERVPSPKRHVLIEVNAIPDTTLVPVHTAYDVDEDGAYLSLIYRTSLSFDHARLVRDGKVLFPSVILE